MWISWSVETSIAERRQGVGPGSGRPPPVWRHVVTDRCVMTLMCHVAGLNLPCGATDELRSAWGCATPARVVAGCRAVLASRMCEEMWEESSVAWRVTFPVRRSAP